MENKNYINQKSFIKRWLCSFLLIMGAWTTNLKAQTTQTFATSGTFTVPAGVTSITVSAWGGGGAGGGVDGNGSGKAGGGGEGGSFVRGTLTVVPGSTYTVVVGNGGLGVVSANGGSGQASSFSVPAGATLFNAIGGAFGAVANNFGAGGNATNTGNIVSGTTTSNFYGGNGGTATSASTASSGGGGGSAGAGGAGGNGGSPLTGGTAGAGSGSPTDAGVVGATGRGSSNDGDGNDGGAPGAGGSGARNANNNTNYQGGDGGAGQVKVLWTCSSYALTATSGTSPICTSTGSSLITLTGSAAGLPVGTYTVTYNRSLPSATGLTAAMTVSVAGSGSFTATGLSTAGSSTITVTNLTSGATGGTCNSSISSNNTSAITVNGSPTISSQPSAQAICPGSPVTFSVTVTGTPTYQWQKANVDISGATNSSFNIASVSAGDVASYRVVLTNLCGSLTSNGAALTLNTAPSISVNPASQTKCTGTSVTFNSTASATPAPTYQWRKDGVNISGATTATYNIASVTAGSAANYDVVVTNTCGTAASTAAVLTVNVTPAAPTVTPSSTAVIAGQSASLTASGTGTSFAWYSASTGGSLLGSNAVFNTPGSCSNASYYAEQTSSAGCTSTRATASVTATPLAAPAAVNGSICGLGTATISGTPATGGNTLSWYAGASGGTALTANSLSYNTTMNASGALTFYASTKLSTLGCESTARTAVTATALPEIIATPSISASSVCPSTPVTVGSDVSRSGKSLVNVSIPLALFTTTNANSPLTVSGFSSALNNTSVKINYVKVNITHGTVSNLKVRLVAPDASVFNLTSQTGSGANYTNTVFQTSGAALTSGTAPYTGTFAPIQAFSNFNGKNPNGTWTLNVQNIGGISAAGTLVNWEINFIDANGLSYSWTSVPAGINSTASSIADNPVQNSSYNLVVNGPGSCSESGSTSVTMLATPETGASSNAPVCVGTGLFFFGSNSASGQTTGNTYAWTGPNGFNSSSQNPGIGSPTLVQSGDYTLTITNVFGCTSSVTTQALVNPNPVLSIVTQNNVSCNGLSNGSVSLVATNGTPSYLYDLDGNLTVNGIYNGLATGTYFASVSDDNGCQATSALNVVITQPAVLSFNSSLINESCLGYANGSVTISAAGGTIAYQYSKDNGLNFQISNSFSNLATGNYDLIVKDAHNCITNSALAVVGTTPDVTPPVIINSPISFSKCNELTSVNWAVPTATDNCTSPVLTSNYNPGDIFPVGVTTVVYTADDGNGNIATSSFNVTVNPLPTVSASDASGCAGNSIALLGTPAGGTWSVANPYTGPSSTYTYTYTDVNGCTNTSAIANITVNPLPTVSASDASGCDGTSIALSGTPTGGTWSVANPYTGPSTTYTYTYTDVNGCTNANTAYITVNPLPIVTASDVSVCIGNSIALSGTPAGGTWSVANPYSGPSTTYTYTYSDVNGCTNISAAANITVNSLPTAAISNDNTICIGGSAQLHIDFTGTGPWNYVVSDGVQNISGIAASSSHDMIVIPSTPGNHDYSITSVSDANCNGTSSGSASIFVNAAPPSQYTISAIAGIPSFACSGTVTLLTATSAGGPGITYSWNNGSGSNPILYSNNIGGPFVAGPFTTTTNQVYAQFGVMCCGQSGYHACVQAVNSCGSTSNKCSPWIQGTVSGPASINPPTAVTACPNDVKNYTCASSSGATLYSWTLSGSSVPITSGQGTTNVTVTFPAAFTSGNLCVTAALACGGSSTSPSRCMTISKTPATPFPIAGPSAICPGTTNVSYSIPVVAGATGYNWSVPAGVTITGGQNTPSITVNFPTPYNGAPSICVTALTPCVNSAGRCMSVYSGIPSQPAAISGPLFNLCGSTGQYSVVSPVAGLTYTWTNPAGTTLTGQGTSTILLAVSSTFNTGVLTVVANSALCAPATSAPRSSSGFWGRPNTPGIITANPNLWCSGGYVNFSIAPAAPLPTYTWTITNGTIGAGNGSNNIDVTWGATTAGTVTVRASNTCGINTADRIQSFSSGCREVAINASSSEVVFSVYPNPAHDNVTLNFNSNVKENVYIDLLDLSGRTVQSVLYDADKGMNKVMIDLKKFSKGAYIVQIKSDKLHQQLPIILQ